LLNKFNANGKDVYGATKKGKDFLLRYSNLKELIEEDNSKNQVKLPPSNLLK
jgi:predicted transcriptional regulator